MVRRCRNIVAAETLDQSLHRLRPLVTLMAASVHGGATLELIRASAIGELLEVVITPTANGGYLMSRASSMNGDFHRRPSLR